MLSEMIIIHADIITDIFSRDISEKHPLLFELSLYAIEKGCLHFPPK